MKCSECSQENPEGAKFCVECGEKFVSPSSHTFDIASLGAELKELREKADLKKVVGDTLSQLVNKSKIIKNAVESTKYRKILEDERFKKAFTWFRASDERLRIPVYILWCYILFGVFGLIPGVFTLINLVLQGTLKEALLAVGVAFFYTFIIIPWAGFCYYYLGYLLRKSEKVRNFLYKERREETFIGNIFLWLLYISPVVFWYVFCWPAEKLYEKYFYRFSRLATGIAYANAGDYNKALEELKQAKVSKFDKEGKLILHVSLADVYVKLGNYDEAKSNYINAIQNCTEENISLTEGMGLCYLLKGQYKDAIKCFRDVQSKDPQNVYAYYGLARCYLILQMYDDAIGYLKQALTLEPQNAATHKMLAEAYIGLGNKDAALKEAKLSLTLKPEPDIAEEAQNIIDYIQYGWDTTKPEEVFEAMGMYDKEKVSAENKTSKSTHIDINEINEYEKQKVLQQVFQSSVVSKEDKNLFCSNSTCKKEIPEDSIFCGFCGTKVVQS